MNLQGQKIILLDLGGVVFQSSGISGDKIDWEIISGLNRKYGAGLDVGEDLFPNFLHEYNQLTNLSLDGRQFLQEVFNTLEMNLSLIKLVKSFGDIIIVSDNYRENISYISRRFNFSEWAIHQVYTYDYQLYKSDPAFFRKLIVDFPEYDPVNMVLIDDSEENIRSASSSGIAGIRYENNAQTARDLTSLFPT